MSVREQWQMICPKCKRDDALDVVARVSVRLTSDGSDEAQDQAHEWGDESDCICMCGWSGKVSDARLACEIDEMPFDEGGVALVLSSAEQFLRDWRENEGANDSDCAFVCARFEKFKPLLLRAPKLLEFVARIAGFTSYEFPEDESWTDDQAEDALVSLNRLIEDARALTVAP